jgi:sigma-B regulation protein RsbU (phosphoserine phosphatase)
MIPAREVGGDFFDYFLLDKDRLGVVIGDVSGKGVPAAIFMAVCRTLLRATALQGVSASECVDYVNSVLVRQSDAAMFVTIFYAILRTSSGEVEYCIAGHNPGYVFGEHRAVEAVGEPRGLMAGTFEHARYETGEIRLAPGDGIILYTDGVPEACDASGCDFTDERLVAAIDRSRSTSAQIMVNGLAAELRAFSAGAPQSDDITAVALRYFGRP